MSEKTPQQEFAAALVAFQTDLPHVGKGSTADTGKFSYTYAALPDVFDAVLPTLTANGLSFTAAPAMTEHGFVLRFALLHSAGHREEGAYPLPDPAKATPQQIGSAITYGRRYCFCAVTGIAPDEGDDGAAASERSASGHHPYDTNGSQTRRGRLRICDVPTGSPLVAPTFHPLVIPPLVTSVKAYSGTYSIRTQLSGGGGVGFWTTTARTPGAAVPVAPSTQYTFSWRMFNNDASFNITGFAMVYYLDSTGATLSTATSSSFTATKQVWQNGSYTFTTPDPQDSTSCLQCGAADGYGVLHLTAPAFDVPDDFGKPVACPNGCPHYAHRGSCDVVMSRWPLRLCPCTGTA